MHKRPVVQTKLRFKAAPAFARAATDEVDSLLAIARRAIATSGFARTGAATLARCRGFHVGFAVLRLIFTIRFHCH